MRTRITVLLAICLTTGITGLSQTYTKPNEPTFDYMTIDPATGQPSLFWTTPRYDPQYPNPIGYIIYRRIIDTQGNDNYFEIDTVDQNTFQFADINSNGNLSRLYYKIASLGITEPSRQTSAHAQIWLTSKYDSCNAKIDLTWNNYEGWKNNDTYDYYKLYMGETTDLSSFTLVDSIMWTTSTYSIKNVAENRNYYFYLAARKKYTPYYTTYSNLHRIFTRMAIRPSYMSIDSITSGDNGNSIYYTIDPATEITNFRIIRWEQADSIQSLFTAKAIEEFSGSTQTSTIDSTDTWASRTRKFYYKLDAYNGCNDVISVSNLCNTMIPRIRAKGTAVHLEWDTLMVDTRRKPDRLGNRVEYTVYRRAYTQNDDVTGLGELSIAASGILGNELDDDLSEFKRHDPLYKIQFKYYVEAEEREPDNSSITFCRSRNAAVEIHPNIIMPNSISPYSTVTNNGRSRARFEPIIDFDATYELTIYNRWGAVIYHGNQGWTGQDNTGKYVKEGTYIYRLVIHTSSSGNVVKDGSVSVVYPKK